MSLKNNTLILIKDYKTKQNILNSSTTNKSPFTELERISVLVFILKTIICSNKLECKSYSNRL